MYIDVHRVWALSRRPANQLGRRLPVGDLHKLIDDHVGFELGFDCTEVIESDTHKVVYNRVCVFGVERRHRRL